MSKPHNSINGKAGIGVTLEIFHFPEVVKDSSLLQPFSYCPKWQSSIKYNNKCYYLFDARVIFGSNYSGFCFQQELLDPSFISVYMHDNNVAH